MNYINIQKKRVVGRNNQPVPPLLIDFSTIGQLTFQFINSNNKIQSIDTTKSYYLAGNINYAKTNVLLFLSQQYTIADNQIVFQIDTYTQNFLNFITKKETQINIQIGSTTDNYNEVLLRDYALANPRVYISGLPPAKLDQYYTKTQSDAKFATLSGFTTLSGIVSADVVNLATNYWTKAQVAQAIAQAGHIKIKVVQTLPPAQQGEDNTIYLVPKTPGQSDVYDQYLRINGQWQKIGSTAVDLTPYLRNDRNETISGTLTVDQLIVSGSNDTVVVGKGNQGLYYSVVFGRLNHDADVGNTLIGTSNGGMGNDNIAVGTNNSYSASFTNLFGRDLGLTTDYSTAIGSYNNITSAKFVVGIGTSNNKKDGLTIDENANANFYGKLSAPSANFDAINNIPTSGFIKVGSNDISQSGFILAYNSSPYTFRPIQITPWSNGYKNITIGGTPTGNTNQQCFQTLITGRRLHLLAGDNIFNYNNHLQNTVGGICINDANGNLVVPSSVISKGSLIAPITASAGTVTIQPLEGKVYTHTLAANQIIDFGNVSNSLMQTFQIQLTQPSTAVTFSWAKTIWWNDGTGYFASSNTPPDFTTGSMIYSIVIRWDGSNWLGNLAYKKQVI